MDFLNFVIEEEILDQEENLVRRPRQIYHRRDPFVYFSDYQFHIRFRLCKENAVNVLDAIRDSLEYDSDRNNPISAMNQLLLTLRYYATGAFFLEMADFMGICKSSAHQLVHKVTEVLMCYRRHWIKLPMSRQELIQVQDKNFFGGFPCVLGMIDGTHVKLYSRGKEYAEEFRNRKGVFSLNVQVVCNAELEVMDIVARWPGRAHDSTIFQSSLVRAVVETGLYGEAVLLGDSAYALSPYMMTPILNPATPEEELYNKCHIHTRNAVERTFGVWKRRFPILALTTQVHVQFLQKVIVTTAILHNMLRKLKDQDPPDDPSINIDWGDILNEDDGDGSHSQALVLPTTRRRGGEIVQQKYVRYYRGFC